ncbi:MAG TPA: DUF6531 domain-containing protein, partial [Gammaproteobacteria bacterium]|nr:DUF6531 domain-containing protein [Gammaproteobacteria bacterium]
MANRHAKSLTTGAGALLAMVVLTVTSLTTLVIAPTAHATGGQCKWEGGQGAAGGFGYCAAEDCIGNGGMAQCSAGVGAPAPGYTDAQVGPDKWVYSMCDDSAAFVGHAVVWCQVTGGTWTISQGTGYCINTPEPFITSNSTSSESAAVDASDHWIAAMYPGCTTSLASDSGWGSVSTYQCWSGSPQQSLDITISGYKQRLYNIGGTCSQSQFDIVLRKDRAAKCPAGYKSRTAVGGPECYLPAECCATRAGNPVSVVTGTKYQREDDYLVAAATGLELSRFYKSTGYYWPHDLTGVLAEPLNNRDFWRHTYDRRLTIVSGNAQTSGVLQAADGSLRIFDASGNESTRNNGTNGTGAKLQAVSGIGWDVTLPTGHVERYNTSGRLISITALNGQVTTLSYSGVNLTTVTGPFGHTLAFGYNSDGLLATVTLPDDGVISYGYDSLKRLTSVTYPDTKTKLYHYENGSNRFLLTGITDEDGVRFATYVYDTAGRVTSESHAGGVASRTFTYGNLGQPTTVTDPLGTSTQFTFTVAAGMYRPASYAQPCLDCGSGGTTYDTGGNIVTRTDFNGAQTTYAYDTTRRLETSRTEAYGTPRARTITTQWHSTFRLPTQIDEPGRRTNFSYDGHGNVLTQTVTDTVTSASHTMTFTYNGAGQVLTMDGPRTDVSDTSTFSYNACAAGGACGQPLTVTDAAGNQMTFSSYDDNGLPLTITDANGTITTLTYDARQRLTSRNVGGETTTIQYWPTGLVKKVTLPDASFLSYEYDDAHRLTKIIDTDGNHIVYTLDGADDVVAESVYDTSDTLVLTKTRQYDALGRLEEEEGSAGQTVSYGYDANGNVLAATDPMGRVTSYAYDELNRLKSMTDAATQLTSFGYDPLDHLLSVTDPRSLTTSYGLDAFGDTVSLASPDTGASAFTHDAAGQVDVATDARSTSADYAHDALGRVMEIEHADQTIELHYDQGTNGAGHLTSIEDGSGTTTWTYDGLGRVAQRTQTTDTVELETGYSYDALGHLQSLTTPSGQVIGYSYTSGRVSGITVNGAALLAGITYEPFGPTTGWEWG